MKIQLDDLEKYIRTNKITVYDIFTEARKMPVYSSSDELTIDETIEKATDTFNSMPSGLYMFRGKKSLTSPNNSIQSVDVLVGNYQELNSPKQSNSSPQRMQSFTQEDIDKQVKTALEMQQKDHDLKECKRMYEALEKKFEKLFTFTQDLSRDFEELLNVVNLEGIRGNGEKDGVTGMVKTAASTAMEHGTKAVIDRFAKYKQ